ncbi:nuclear transport factor 2 family protein [Acidisoma cellulosilytica]|uniref:Nuclear transport factor 2 family protein n=1 Tax=Acidisoma cellulosilyticum TaxID=2802395 RepID=A0A964E227_9PROT|nr:nuclear transport factor 2 family protein [Acidisoma cellulosilyticum]MCB8878849.1 nuclear transport factor 2 family protein [Acidisoma cellulosilyticum]
MSTARELLVEFFDCLRNLNTSVDRCVELFADDGVFEFPYLPTVGLDGRFQGKAEIRGVLELIRSNFVSFTLSKIDIHELKDGSGLFTEYHSECFVGGTERVYAQDYVSRLVVENGKIKLLREYLNVILTARALLPNGLADVPESALAMKG